MIEIPKWMIETVPDELPDVYQRIVDLIGYRSMLALISNYGGDYMYVPKLDQLQRVMRDDKLMADYIKGTTPDQLAHRYNLSVVQVYEIIKKQNKKAGIIGDQISLLETGT